MRQGNVAEKHAVHAIRQVELLNYLLNNLQQFNLKPTTKLVLLYLAGCYNPKHADVFPKQKTIALQMGISERSVISAIQELHKEGLVISERKYTNRYKFTSRVLNLDAHEEVFSEPEEIAEAKCKSCSSESEKFAPPCIEQKEEQLKEQTEGGKYKPVGVDSTCPPIEKGNKGGNVYLFQSEEDRILEDYAIKHGARNVKAYINTLKSSGSANKIIREYKKQKRVTQIALRSIQETQELIKQSQELDLTKQDFFESEAMLRFAKKHGLK